jgi:hypothetical protein
MPLFQVFIPGLEAPLNPALITGGQPQPLSTSPPQQVGLLVQGVNAASAAAAGAACMAAIPGGGNQGGLMHTCLQSNDTTV